MPETAQGAGHGAGRRRGRPGLLPRAGATRLTRRHCARAAGWCMEIGYAQAAAVLALGEAARLGQAGSCRKDYGGNDRVVLLQKN